MQCGGKKACEVPTKLDSLSNLIIEAKADKVAPAAAAKEAAAGEEKEGVEADKELVAEVARDPVVEIASGALHLLARTESGKLFAWGNNKDSTALSVMH